MSAVDVTNQGGTMSENTELDRLRAEVTSTAIGLKLAIDERDRLRAEVERALDAFAKVHDRAVLAEADNRVLRARLAKVEALADEWQRACDRGENGRHGYHSAEYGDDYANDLRAALASVPEPSASGFDGPTEDVEQRLDALAEQTGKPWREPSGSEPVANPRGDDRETASEPAPNVAQALGADILRARGLDPYDPECVFDATGCKHFEHRHDEPAPDADREAGRRVVGVDEARQIIRAFRDPDYVARLVADTSDFVEVDNPLRREVRPRRGTDEDGAS